MKVVRCLMSIRINIFKSKLSMYGMIAQSLVHWTGNLKAVGSRPCGEWRTEMFIFFIANNDSVAFNLMIGWKLF